MTCRNGHELTGPRCKECKKERDRRWYTSERGREQRRQAQQKYYYESMSGPQYNLRLLKNRRYKALQARERRRSGKVPEQGRD